MKASNLAQAQTWELSKVLTIDTLVDCGPITVEFYNEDATLSTLDPVIF